MAKAKKRPMTPPISGKNATIEPVTNSLYASSRLPFTVIYLCKYGFSHYFLLPIDFLMKEITYPPITNASPIPTKENKGQRLAPVSCTPLVTLAMRSPGVVEPRKSIFCQNSTLINSTNKKIILLVALLVEEKIYLTMHQ